MGRIVNKYYKFKDINKYGPLTFSVLVLFSHNQKLGKHNRFLTLFMNHMTLHQ